MSGSPLFWIAAGWDVCAVVKQEGWEDRLYLLFMLFLFTRLRLFTVWMIKNVLMKVRVIHSSWSFRNEKVWRNLLTEDVKVSEENVPRRHGGSEPNICGFYEGWRRRPDTDILLHIWCLRFTKQSFTLDKQQRGKHAEECAHKHKARTHRPAGMVSSVFFQTQTFHNWLSPAITSSPRERACFLCRGQEVVWKQKEKFVLRPSGPELQQNTKEAVDLCGEELLQDLRRFTAKRWVWSSQKTEVFLTNISEKFVSPPLQTSWPFFLHLLVFIGTN